MAADLNRAVLLYRSGPARDFPLPEVEAIVGYGGGAVVRVPMEGVSRQHAKISFDGKDYFLEDAGSSNGTFLNGVRLIRRERLRHLDVVALGRYTELIFVRKTGESARVARTGIKAAFLEALDGAEAGNRRPIPRGSVTIGRDPSNNVVTDSQLVSKIHARLECTELQLVLTDLHSHNGTFVDGQKIVEARILKDGAEFMLGGTRRFRVRIEEGSIETSGIAPLPALARSDPSLPMDWKTRLEWSPEEVESFERERKAETARREAVKAREAAAPAKATAKAAAPANAEVKHPAPAPSQEAKAPAPAPQPEGPPAAKPKAAVPPEPKKRADSAEPPPVPPAKPAAAATAKPAPPPTRPMEAAAPVSPPPAKAAPPLPESVSAPVPAPPSAPAASRITDVGERTGPLPADAISNPRIHLEGNLEGKDLNFALVLGDHVVGRVPEVPVHLDGTEISRRHAVIRVGLSEVTVEDLGSRNGTFVNRERITAPRSLKDGDVIHFGDVPLRVRFPGGS